LVVSGTVIPDWQWFDEVEHAARAAFVVHTGGSIDDEHGGWARLFKGVAESLVQARDEHQAAREATERLSNRYRRLLAQDDAPTTSTSARPVWSLPVPVRCPLPGCTGAGGCRRSPDGPSAILALSRQRRQARATRENADRESGVDGGEQGRVVDAVADREHGTVSALPLCDSGVLVDRQQPGPDVGDPERRRDDRGGSGRIAGEQHGRAAGERRECSDRAARLLTHGVGHR
jgi:hypothetical protein